MPTPVALTMTLDAPTVSVTQAATPIVFELVMIPAEPEPGGSTDTHGAGAGLGLDLSLVL